MTSPSAKFRSKTWKNWRELIATEFDHLTRGMTAPIPLRGIFEQCRVKKVIFQPLLVEGGLAVDYDGFVVFINSPEYLMERYKREFNDEGREARYLPGHIRFSLAHELAHTLFYDKTARPYRRRIAAKHPQQIESLESACNRGAARLLMPTKLLEADINKRDLLSLNNLTELTRKYRVSLQCLIHRLEEIDQWTRRQGLVALATEDDGKLVIKAVAKSVSTRKLFAHLKRDTEFAVIFKGTPDLKMLDKPSGSFDYELTYQGVTEPKVAKCFIEYRRITADSKAFLLVVSVEKETRIAKQRIPRKDAERRIAALREVINRKAEPSSEKLKLTTQ